MPTQRVPTSRIENGVYEGEHRGVSFTVEKWKDEWVASIPDLDWTISAPTKAMAVNLSARRIEITA